MSENGRPAVSLSMAGHCRLAIYLKANGAEEEKPTALVQRKFDFGHMVESAVFDKVLTPGGSAESIGPWWNSAEKVTDYSTGEEYDPASILIDNRQEEVEVEGYKGHLDAIGGPEPFRVMDSKSMPSYSWQRNIKDDLMGNVFSREMVMQQQMYVRGLRSKRPGLGVEGWMLVMVNRDDLKMAVRTGAYDEALVEEGIERLSWGRSKVEPEPDYKWEKGQEIGLRCRYCGVKEACAEIRGVPLTLFVEKKGPKWIAG